MLSTGQRDCYATLLKLSHQLVTHPQEHAVLISLLLQLDCQLAHVSLKPLLGVSKAVILMLEASQQAVHIRQLLLQLNGISSTLERLHAKGPHLLLGENWQCLLPVLDPG